MANESSPPKPRTCPSCGTTTDLRFCPQDGTATVEGRALFADPTVLRPGDVINGRYRITALVGRGGFGAVYSGEHTGTHQLVALKLLMPSDDDAHTDVRRFHQEAQLTASLRHPNTVRVFDVGQTQHGALFLAMELLHGETLEDRLQLLEARGQALPQEETLDMAIQTLKALGEAHGKGLVHRDLKPANLMLTELEGEPLLKVLDFGIARRKGSTLTGHGRALGTPAYMSPEQCMGDEVDGRADLYALGCILFRCLAGRTPFEAESAFATMQGHALAPVPDLTQKARGPVAPGLKAAIEKVLAKEPKQRFQHAKEMRERLELVRSSLVPDDEAPTMAWRSGNTVPPVNRSGSGGPGPRATAVPGGVSPEVAAPQHRPSAAQPRAAAAHAATQPATQPRPTTKGSAAAPPRDPRRVAPRQVQPRRVAVDDTDVVAPTERDVAATQREEYEALPTPGLPKWLPWLGGALLLAALAGFYLAWR